MASEPTVVLLICADRDSAARLAAAIQPSGHRVIAVPFGPTAISKAHSAHLIVVDRVEGTVDAVSAVRRVKSAPALAPVPLLAIAQGDNVDERVRLLEAGADDVISRPVDPAELELRLEGLLLRAPDPSAHERPAPPHELRPPSGPRLIVFLSPKGGVGTTTLAVNSAVTLARGGRAVAIIDLDLSWGQVATHLNVRPRFSVVDIARDESALDDPEIMRGYAELKDGLAVYSSPLRPDQAELMAPDRVRRLLASAQAAFDIIIVDAGSSFDERTLTLLEQAERVAIVAVPEIPALRAIHALLEMLVEYSGPTDKRLFVLNHLFPEDMLTRDDVRRSLGGSSLILEVPYDPVNFHQAANRGVPLVTGAPRSPAADRIVRLAATLVGDLDGDQGDGARKLRLTGLLRRG